MTIDELNALTALTAGDEIPVWDAEASGEPTQKITAQQLAAAVKALAGLPSTTEMNTAIASALQRTNITSQITVNNSHVRIGTANAFLIGGLGVLSFSLDIDSSLANNTTLLTFASTMNIQGLYVMGALFKSTSALASTASVWFERVNGATVVKYYQTSAPATGQYFAQLVFMLQP